MGDLLGNLEAYIRTLPKVDVRVALAQASLAGDPPMRADAEATQADRDLFEDEKVCAHQVGVPTAGGFTCFMDGMQRPRGPIYINSPVPILYGYIAAVIRTRGSDKKMRTLPGFHVVDEALYLPKKIAQQHGIEISGVTVVDTGDVDAIEHPLALAQAAHDKISTVRGRLESKIASEWVSRPPCDGWLLVDGSLQADYGEADIAGVTKSHSTQYLTWEEQQVALALKPGERSSAFVPIVKGGRRPVCSWYLRMHPSEGKDPYFGLIRVEIPRSSRALDMVDEISRWLLAERAPLSLPDSRWDKMIYPIRDCELYMKSLAPSHTSLDAQLMRLSAIAASE
ncbi:MAG: hypothetical protein GX139_05535 [Armatimonadetes bacterium]|nr:hypothetical protein [Armatimonadota bacterium]